MAVIVSTRILRLQAISPRYATVGLGLGTSISYGSVTGTPTALSDVNSTEGAKLGGIAAGATVGATWGTNLNSVPAFLGTPSGSGLFSSNTNFGYYTAGAWKTYMDSSGNFYLAGSGTHSLTWNQSAGTLSVRGSLNADDISAGTLTGRVVQTASSGDRVVLNESASNTLRAYLGTTKVVELGGSGSVWAKSVTTGQASIQGESTSTGAGVLGTTSANGSAGVIAETTAGTSPALVARVTGSGTGPAIQVNGRIEATADLAVSLGGAAVRWNTVYAGTFSGNATTATTASACAGNAATATTAAACSGNAATATQISNSGHTYTFSGGTQTGAATATFTGVKPGSATSNAWLAMVIDGGTYYLPVWT